MIQISQENIEKYKFKFKSGLYKRDTAEAILYNEKLEAEKQAILDSRPYAEKRKEAFDNNPLTKINNLVVAIFEKMVAEENTSPKMDKIEIERQRIKAEIQK